MRKALIKRGIPQSAIVLDYAGFRTLDSVVRSKEVFGQNKITIISQGFHNSRAIYIASHYDIEAIGYNAKDIKNTTSYFIWGISFIKKSKVSSQDTEIKPLTPLPTSNSLYKDFNS